MWPDVVFSVGGGCERVRVGVERGVLCTCTQGFLNSTLFARNKTMRISARFLNRDFNIYLTKS